MTIQPASLKLCESEAAASRSLRHGLISAVIYKQVIPVEGQAAAGRCYSEHIAEVAKTGALSTSFQLKYSHIAGTSRTSSPPVACPLGQSPSDASYHPLNQLALLGVRSACSRCAAAVLAAPTQECRLVRRLNFHPSGPPIGFLFEVDQCHQTDVM